MPRAVILAEPGSGSTTFVALLYAALVRAAVERETELRFSVAPESVTVLAEMYARLMSGEFPETPGPPEIAAMRVTLAFPSRSRHRVWTGKRADFSDVPKVECRWVQARFEEIEASLRGGNTSADPTASLGECTIPVFLLSAPGFEAGRTPDPSSGPSLDDSVLHLVQGLARPLEATRRSNEEVLRPIFVFTQSDLCSAGVLGHFGLKVPLDDGELGQERRRLGSVFLREWLPRTAEFCESARSTVGPPEIFFSFLQTESRNGGEPRIQVRTRADHTREIVGASHQYQALISYLGELSA